MERNWNVIKFTCGLMGDSSELIQSVCKVFAEHKMSIDENNRHSFGYLYDHSYLQDLSLESSPQCTDPFNNSEICCMSNNKSALGENCSLDYFYGTGEYMKYIKIHTDQRQCRQGTKPCGIVINEANSSSFMYTTFNACSLISQPIKFIQIHGYRDYKISLESNVPRNRHTEKKFLNNLKSLGLRTHFSGWKQQFSHSQTTFSQFVQSWQKWQFCIQRI